MRRIILLFTAATVTVVMLAASAAPAFAVPPNPSVGVKGQSIAQLAKTYPTDPIRGQVIADFARSAPCECGGGGGDSP